MANFNSFDLRMIPGTHFFLANECFVKSQESVDIASTSHFRETMVLPILIAVTKCLAKATYGWFVCSSQLGYSPHGGGEGRVVRAALAMAAGA